MRLLALFAVVALNAACAMTPAQRREENLVREARTFNDDLRWQRYEQLSESLPPEEARLLQSRAEAMGDDLAMADYDVTSITFAPGSEAANVVVKFSWYSKRATTLHETTVDQRWEYQSGRWVLVKQRRARGERFPLIPEPAPPPAPAP